MNRLPVFLILTGLLFALPPLPAAAAAPIPAVTLLASTTAPYVGEEVVLTLEVRLEGRLAERPLVLWPALDDVVTEELPPSPPRREEGGQALVESARRIVRPLTSGRCTLQGGGILLGERFLPAAPLVLRVRPLPASGRPEDFAGAVGGVSMELEGAGVGTGDRDLVLTLEGNAPLASFPSPRAEIPSGARLIPLGDRTTGLPGEVRRRRFRFRYLPAPENPSPPLFSLTVFDPSAESYRRLEAPASAPPSRPAPLVTVVALAGLLLLLIRSLRRPRSVEASLAALLGRPPGGACRQRILEELRAAGVPASDTAELARCWEAEDRARFAPEAIPLPPGHAARRRRIASRLRKAVDKKLRIS